MRKRRCHFGLEIATDTQPIEGLVIDASGAKFPFAGWLDLASAIEKALKLIVEPEPMTAEMESSTNRGSETG